MKIKDGYGCDEGGGGSHSRTHKMTLFSVVGMMRILEAVMPEELTEQLLLTGC